MHKFIYTILFIIFSIITIVDATPPEILYPAHIVAVYEGKNNELLEYIRRGHPINAPSPDDGATALHFAVAVGNIEAVRILLDHDANRYQQDNDGNTPLHTLVLKHDSRDMTKLYAIIAALLLSNNNENLAYIENHIQETPLYIATRNKDLLIIETFVNFNLNFNLQTMNNISPWEELQQEDILLSRTMNLIRHGPF